MTPNPPPGPGGRPRRGRRLALVIPVVAAMLAAQPVPAAAEDTTAAAGLASGADRAATGRTYPVTLVTGDEVVLHIAADGSQAAWLEEPATTRPARPPQIFEQDGQVHVIPAEAAPYLVSGVLDDRLFNVTYLAHQGYDDTSRNDLPLLLAAPDGPAAAQVPDLPPGSREVRRLDSIDAVSVTASKSRMREVWESLRGPDPAALDADHAQLAGAGRVWLNGRVEATLSDSVRQVGAPSAWEAGLDGDGVPVAVLDTGYDPDHPDLAGQVEQAHNFTDDQDPPGETAVDGNGHGTHVAATVAGTGAASGGDRTGVAPGADLMIGKVLNDAGSGFDDWVIAGMEWAVEEGAEVVSMSLGTPWASDGTDPLSQAVDRLTETSGTLFVIAAGNSGPIEQTVGSPGAATRALTVGATTKDDQAAGFSSRGPRWGDGAIKPEIVAPGVGIVAARAAGTSLGNLVDEHYTSLNGTSMATPHVAGAAAIMAQQHPDWDADEIKARLVTTSAALPGQPITFQGAGRLDVAAAVGSPITVDHGALSLGRIDHDADQLTRTLTYHNASDAPMTLRLSPDVTGTGTRTDRTPALRVHPSALVVPAGGQASAEVRFTPGATKPGGYAGHILARDQRTSSPPVRTVLSATVDGPLHTVTVTGVDRDGQPASGSVQLWSAETGDLAFGFLADGATELRVPEGLYTLVAALETMDGSWPPASYTMAGEPELTVRKDRELRYDARAGQPLRVATPREADRDRVDVMWHREVGDRSVSSIAAQAAFDERLYTLPSKPARTGSFEFSSSWQLLQPLLTARVGGPDGFELRPSPALASPPNAYVGQESLPVVYAGEGTPEEYADLDVAGKVALVTRRDGFGHLAAQAEAARQAGAVLLLAHNNAAGSWLEQAWNGPLPSYVVDQHTGTALRQAIAQAGGGEAVLDLAGIRDSTYSYLLALTEPGAVPDGRTYHTDDLPLAVVESDYRQNSERMGRNEMWIPYADSGGLGNGIGLSRNGPVERTEYVSTEGVRWQRFAQPHGEFANVYWTWSGLERYQPGETYQQLWWGPLTRPGVPPVSGSEQLGMPVARFHDAIRILMPHYMYDNGARYGTIFEQLGDASELTLRRDGEVVGKSSWPEMQFTVPADQAWYELELVVANGQGNFMDTSVATESTWRFTSSRPDDRREVLPLVQVDYHLDTGPYNEVPAGTPYPLRLDPGYQPGADGPGEFSVSVEVSYDDGDSWVGAPVGPADGMLAAQLPAAPAGAGFASVRVVATDSTGNSLTQLIERAWRVD